MRMSRIFPKGYRLVDLEACFQYTQDITVLPFSRQHFTSLHSTGDLLSTLASLQAVAQLSVFLTNV